MTHRKHDTRYLARLHKFCALRWMLSDGINAGERWFGALGRVERQLRLARQFQQQHNTPAQRGRNAA